MQEILTGCAFAVLVALLAVLLKKEAPTQAFLLAVAAVVILLGQVASRVIALQQDFAVLTDALNGQAEIYTPVFRAVGIAAVVRIVVGLCKDAGQSALAMALDLAGTVAVLYVCLPLFEQVLGVISTMAA